jgi:hypothetical protein
LNFELPTSQTDVVEQTRPSQDGGQIRAKGRREVWRREKGGPCVEACGVLRAPHRQTGDRQGDAGVPAPAPGWLLCVNITVIDINDGSGDGLLPGLDWGGIILLQ